jgi:CRISPR-associated exonuclease Cas4
MKCLGIKQYEEKRYKVQKGRNIHEKRLKENKDYLRKRIGVIGKEVDVSLVSNKYKVRGKVDEVLTLNDNTMSPLDYKFAKFDEKIYITYRSQILLYSLMIEETYDKVVNKGYIIYCRDGYEIKEILITEKDKKEIKEIIKKFILVTEGYYPKPTNDKRKCLDCCYKNICIK